MNFTGGEYVIQVRMCMDDADNFQTHGLNRGQDTLCISTRVKNIADSTITVTENGAVALKRSDGEGLADDVHKNGLFFVVIRVR